MESESSHFLIALKKLIKRAFCCLNVQDSHYLFRLIDLILIFFLRNQAWIILTAMERAYNQGVVSK